jgi:hypothetical protein
MLDLCLIAIVFVLLEVIWVVSFIYYVEYERICDDVREPLPMVCAKGWTVTSSREAYSWIVNEFYAQVRFTHSYLQYSPDDAKVPLRF